ncbi:hypothetical protein B0H66DRAFT_350412 [Apodospora peruviana]|uniref:T6SS Phospholipase effector Tle1-like catalytic domain-containing protein n=1 Tax=Apodospora peruviana TaxID=516989 RepID=A0AAE0HUZ3_9PEZI|nr:hypothetical protein B0H66DRAFT_350412 [Apodospora peruviana]
MDSDTTPMATPGSHAPSLPKRIILCCDGTWLDSLGKKGYEPPSNVTRITRVFRRTCSDGTPQIINYVPGVGTGTSSIDHLTGGAFGMGLDQDIRQVYNFICTNYVDGDSIILVGFSRGAFTARSTADMIGSLGLLTPEGLDRFYTIFNDYENIGDKNRGPDQFLVPGLPEYNGSHGQAKIEWEKARMFKYKQGLKDLRYTRDTFQDGVTEITIKAIAVWDTVGTLGIPPAPVIGVRGSADQWRFTNTQISNHVQNAFQALALDEPRYAFRPALWERAAGSKTNLKQVWFPGNHGNVGGSWYDQQIADISLAWMCDQLSTLGVEFNITRLTNTFMSDLRFSSAHPFPFAPPGKSIIPSGIDRLLHRSVPPIPWANKEIYRPTIDGAKRDSAECDGKDKHPDASTTKLWQRARPWGLGMIRYPTSITTLAGKTVRRPGLFMRCDEDTNEDTDEPLLNTAESIHSSVRVRLVCGGLGMDDKEVWGCDSLKGEDGKPIWRLERGSGFSDEEEIRIEGFRPREPGIAADEYKASYMYPTTREDTAWRWRYIGLVKGSGDTQVPHTTVLPEEPLVGYWERYLLALFVGEADVWKFAQRGLPDGF